MTDTTQLSSLFTTEQISTYFTNISTVAQQYWTLYGTTQNLAYLAVGVYSIFMAVVVPLLSFYGLVILTLFNFISKINWFTAFKLITAIPTTWQMGVVFITTPIISQNFWVWMLDGLNILDLKILWSIVWPYDKERDVTGEDTWVQANTWAVDMIEIAVMKYENTNEFDYKTQSDKFLQFGWLLLSEHFAPAEWVIFWLWFSQSIWFWLFPSAYIDDEGFAKPGWPQAIARTRDFMKILMWDPEPFLSNPDGDNLRLGLFDFYQMILAVLVNWILSSFNYLLYDVPYCLNFVVVLIMYIFY